MDLLPNFHSSQPIAIVIGLDSLPGIQAARILARCGVPVLAIARRPRHYCCRTTVCQKILFADTQTEEFIDLLAALGPSFRPKPVLYPCTDMSVLLLSRQRVRLEDHYHMALAAPSTVETLMSKERFAAYALEKKLPIPATLILNTPAEAELAAAQLTFPCILKPALRTVSWTAHSPDKVLRVARAEELLPAFERCAAWTLPLIVQEWIEGPDSSLYSCNCYFDRKSHLVASFVARKLRQWPPHAGISSLGEECRNDLVRDQSLRLFEAAGYVGPGYVEMKCDQRTGQYFILEANIGRPTVRSAIAEAGGVELLYAMYCDLCGFSMPDQLEQRFTGVKWIHLHYDVRSAYHYWRQGELTLKEWWRSWQGRKTHALFSWRDPAPFFFDILGAFWRLLRRQPSS
jgi:D-aspartate ligase